jgi:hypothetical protein
MVPAAYLPSRRRWLSRLSVRRTGRLLAFLVVWLGALISVGPLVYILVQSLTSSSRDRFAPPPVASYSYIVHSD